MWKVPLVWCLVFSLSSHVCIIWKQFTTRRLDERNNLFHFNARIATTISIVLVIISQGYINVLDVFGMPIEHHSSTIRIFRISKLAEKSKDTSQKPHHHELQDASRSISHSPSYCSLALHWRGSHSRIEETTRSGNETRPRKIASFASIRLPLLPPERPRCCSGFENKLVIALTVSLNVQCVNNIWYTYSWFTLSKCWHSAVHETHRDCSAVSGRRIPLTIALPWALVG